MKAKGNIGKNRISLARFYGFSYDSKYSIITSDEDFEKPDSYIGIEREKICVEPHYNDINNNVRNSELKEFAKRYNTKIYCIPDESIIYFENGIKNEKGKIYTII